MLFLYAVLGDYPTCCYNDQVLGRWELNLTKYDIKPDNDNIPCPDDFKASSTKHVRLISPNLAIDEDGYVGTWSIIYNQALEVKVGGYVYSWYLDYKLDENNSNVISNCSCSMKRNGWSHRDGFASR